MSRCLAGIATLLCLGGCAVLDVEMGVLSPGYVKAQTEELRVLAELQTLLDTGAYQQRIDEIIAQETNKLVESLPDADPTAAGQRCALLGLPSNCASVSPAELESSIREDVERSVDPWLAELRQHDASARAAFDRLPAKDRDDVLFGRAPVPASVRHALAERRRFLADSDAVFAGLRFPSSVRGAALLEESGKRTVNEIDRARRTGIGEDPAAFAVASAKDKYWADEFNQSFARGFFGNLDVAVKFEQCAEVAPPPPPAPETLDAADKDESEEINGADPAVLEFPCVDFGGGAGSIGEFTLKGVSFDPNQVARVASKVTTQALMIAVQITGRMGTTGADTGDGLASGGEDAANVRAAVDAYDALRADQRRALLELGSLIGGESMVFDDDSEAGKPKRTRAIEVIKEAFEERKERIRLPKNAYGGAPRDGQGGDTPPPSTNEES